MSPPPIGHRRKREKLQSETAPDSSRGGGKRAGCSKKTPRHRGTEPSTTARHDGRCDQRVLLLPVSLVSVPLLPVRERRVLRREDRRQRQPAQRFRHSVHCACRHGCSPFTLPALTFPSVPAGGRTPAHAALKSNGRAVGCPPCVSAGFRRAPCARTASAGYAS